MAMLNSETWVPMPRGFESNYEVSNLGRVRRIGGRVLKPMVCGASRPGAQTLKVRISTNPRRDASVAELVLTAFVGPRRPGMFALHGDDNKHNNAVTNLRWGTPGDNARDAAARGRYSQQVLRGTDVTCIREMHAAGFRLVEIAAMYGVSSQRICDVTKGRTSLGGGHGYEE